MTQQTAEHDVTALGLKKKSNRRSWTVATAELDRGQCNESANA